VPKKIEDAEFWKNYFLRVNMIRAAYSLPPVDPRTKKNHAPADSEPQEEIENREMESRNPESGSHAPSDREERTNPEILNLVTEIIPGEPKKAVCEGNSENKIEAKREFHSGVPVKEKEIPKLETINSGVEPEKEELQPELPKKEKTPETPAPSGTDGLNLDLASEFYLEFSDTKGLYGEKEGEGGRRAVAGGG
jgi:hypothetical protein